MAAPERGTPGPDLRDGSREPAVSGTVTVGDRLLFHWLLDALDGLRAPRSERPGGSRLWRFAAQLHGKGKFLWLAARVAESVRLQQRASALDDDET